MISSRFLRLLIQNRQQFKQPQYKQCGLYFQFSVMRQPYKKAYIEGNSYLEMLVDQSRKDELIDLVEKQPDQINQILKQIQQIPRMYKDNSSEIFEQKYFRSYVYLIDQYLRMNKQKLKENLDENISVVSRIANIYNNMGNLTFQKQEVLAKKVIQLATEDSLHLNLNQLNKIFLTISTFDIRNTNEDALFFRLKNALLDKDTHSIDVLIDIHFNITKIASKRKNRLEKNAILVLVEMMNSVIFEMKGSLSFQNVTKICSSLSQANTSANKLLLIELARNLEEHITRNKLFETSSPENKNIVLQHMQAFVAMTSIEDTVSHGLYYIYELDDYYQSMYEIIHLWIDSFSPSLLGTIATSLQRTSYYDSKLLIKITSKITEYDFYGFEENDESSEVKRQLRDLLKEIKYKKEREINSESKEKIKLSEGLQNLIKQENKMKKELAKYNKKIVQNYNNINSMFKIIHCMGQYNIRNDSKINQQAVDQFINYFYQVVELFALKFQKEKTTGAHFEPKYVTRCIWALCVLDTPERIAKPLNSLINQFLFNEENAFYELNKSDVAVLYYSYLYLQQHSKIFPQSLVEILHTVYSQQILKQKKNISMLCLDVQKYLNSVKIPNNLELNVDNILVDIQIPKTLYGKQIILDVHGYQHYFRNEEVLKGNTIIKKKIIEQYYNYVYEIVPIFEWELLDNQHKQEYLLKLFENLKEKIKSDQLSQPNKTTL